MTTLTSLQQEIKVHVIKMDTSILALFCVIIAIFLLFTIIRNTTTMSKKIKFVKQIVLRKVGVLNSSTQVLPLPLHQVERKRSMINVVMTKIMKYVLEEVLVVPLHLLVKVVA